MKISSFAVREEAVETWTKSLDAGKIRDTDVGKT